MANGSGSPVDDWKDVDDWKTVATPSPRAQVEVPPFPVDDWFSHQVNGLPPEEQADKRGKFASVMYEMAKPWMDLGYSAGAGLNRGMANFSAELDSLAGFFEHMGLGKRGGMFSESAKEYEANAQLLESRLPKEGVTALNKVYRFAGSAAGQMVPGTAQFLMDWSSGLSIPFASGAQEAREHETDPTIGGLVKAAQVGMLGTMFHMTAPLKAWLRAGVLGSYFGAEEAIASKPGERATGFVKGAAVGGLLGVTTPSGRYGLRDIYPEVERAAPASTKPTTPTPQPDTLRPAVKTPEGKIEQGVAGETHPEVLERTGVKEAAQSETKAPYTFEALGEVVPKGKKFYHGTQDTLTDIKEADPGSKFGELSMYGPGLYLTDNPNVASGYAKTRKAEAGNAKVLFSDISGARLYDAEKPMPPEVRNKVENALDRYGIDLPDDASLSQAYAEMRGISRYEGIPAYEVQEDFADINQSLADMGYDGLRHEGGKYVGKKQGKHNVAVMFPDFTTGKGTIFGTRKGALEPQEMPAEAQASLQAPIDTRGFVNREGKFLDREKAKQWVKENEPEVYSAWSQLKNGDEGAELHSQDYNAAKELAKEPDPSIRELTSALRNITPETDLGRRVSLAEDLTMRAGIAKEGVQNSLTRIKTMGAALRDFYMRPPKADGIRGMIDLYKGSKQISDMENARFAKQIKGTFSDRTQRALTAYAQANGDSATLTEWADKTTDPVLKEKYQDALALTDQQKQFASDYRAHMDAMLDRAIDSGLLEDGVENYVSQIWEKKQVNENPAARRMLGESNSGLLRKNPFLAKKRIYDSYFEGEQAGHTPKDARLGYLTSAYHQAFDEALNARAFLRSLTEQNASDGRPMAVTSGMGIPLPKGESPAESWVIKPRAVSLKVAEMDPITGETTKTPVDLSDYSNRGIDHPALRKWKWAASDNDGNPIFVEGDLKLHPEAYRDVKNFLGKSAIREYAIGRAALRVSSEVKGTMLGFFSTFHQVHLGKTAASYVVNPFNPGAIDLEDPLTRGLIEHGHVLYDGNAMSEWSEGVRGPGLIRFIPKIGPMAERYTEYMFGLDGYVPRLKNQLAHTIYERNAARYPELSRDELLTLTASESNAAMGGQDWRGMMANKTGQDLLRITTLAPDFLISRIRLTGQALKPYGREQFNAIAIRGAIGLYVTAKVIEGALAQIEPDKAELRYDRPFSVTYNGKEYTIRSQQGDIYHFISNPRNFAYYRLNPAISKPAIEMMTGRDQFGRKRDVVGQLKDWATAAVPIAGQGFFKKEDYPLYQSILASIGVSSWDFKSDAERTARDIAAERNKAEFSAVSAERIRSRTQLRKEYDKTGDFEPIRQAWADGKISFKDIQWITNRTLKGDLPSMVAGFSVEEGLKVWRDATQEEKRDIQPLLVAKWLRFQTSSTPKEVSAYEDEMQKVMQWGPTRELKPRRRFSIQ